MHQDLATSSVNPPIEPRKLESSKYRSRFAVTEITAKTGLNTTRRLVSTASFDQSAAVMKAEANEIVTSTRHAPNHLCGEAAEDFRCSVSGVAFDQSERVILGFGVNVTRRSHDRSIESITTDLTPISMEIFFKGKIRKSALGAKMTHFFPFAINEQHWQKAKRVLPGCVGAILRSGPENITVQSDKDRLLFVIGELWKSMAVLMMKGGTHASEKVLKGFCSLHHILLCATELPDHIIGGNSLVKAAVAEAVQSSSAGVENETWVTVVRGRSKPTTCALRSLANTSALQSLANRRVRSFAKFPRMRHKSQCPDFGRLLPQILLSNVDWQHIQNPFVSELLTRGARWICRADHGLSKVHPNERTSLTDRAQRSWVSHNTGLKLTAFQIRFALNVLPWASEALSREVVSAYEASKQHHLMICLMYNQLGGRPTQQMLSRFQKETKAIEAMKSFREFFQMIDMPRDDISIQLMLCDAMEDSKRLGYRRS